MDWGYVILIMLVSGVGSHMMLGMYKRLLQKDSALTRYLMRSLDAGTRPELPPKPAPPRNVIVPPATVRVGRGSIVGGIFARLGMAIGWLCSRLVRRVHDDTLRIALAEWPAQAQKRAAAMRAVMREEPQWPTPKTGSYIHR